jgi:hypothetical protein
MLHGVWGNTPRCNSSYTALIQPISYLLLFLNSSINPVLYAFLSARFRRACAQLFCRRNDVPVNCPFIDTSVVPRRKRTQFTLPPCTQQGMATQSPPVLDAINTDLGRWEHAEVGSQYGCAECDMASTTVVLHVCAESASVQRMHVVNEHTSTVV